MKHGSNGGKRAQVKKRGGVGGGGTEYIVQEAYGWLLGINIQHIQGFY